MLGRAMALLRLDRLIDADRAISDLRKRGPATGSPAGDDHARRALPRREDRPPGRSVRAFQAQEMKFRRQLGHRSGDAHALVARAFDLLDREPEAAAAYDRATRLVPVNELHERYPETRPLAAKFAPAVAPGLYAGAA